MVERQKAKQAARLEHLFAESRQAWEQSKADTKRRRQRVSAPSEGGSGKNFAELTTENQHGDPRYLEECRKALADLRKLWGLDAPQKVDLRAARNPFAELPEAQLRELLDRQNKLLEAGERPAVVDVTPTPEGGEGDV